MAIILHTKTLGEKHSVNQFVDEFNRTPGDKKGVRAGILTKILKEIESLHQDVRNSLEPWIKDHIEPHKHLQKNHTNTVQSFKNAIKTQTPIHDSESPAPKAPK
jgi:hypothetical protein